MAIVVFVKIVLVPVDFSWVTELLVDFAGNFAARIGAYVVLLHVRRADGAGIVGPGELADVALQRLKQTLRERNVTAQSLLLTGNPAADIVEQAGKLRAGYIVMGSHGHGPLHRLLLGTTSGAVLKAASCPVILLPPGYEPGRPPPSLPSSAVKEQAVGT
jgi:nucleotide-binding universal stress UspA family protein